MPTPIPLSHPPEDLHPITCLHCHRQQEVARHAVSVTCKFCNQRLKVEGISVTHYEARRQFATCGVLTVEKKGTIVAESILCGRIVVRGKIKASIHSQGPVLITRDAEVQGNVTAPSLAVGAGAILEGQYNIGPKTPQPPQNP